LNKSIYINLPVQDLAASTHFYETIGFEKNNQFSNDKAAGMGWSDTINFMLLTHEFFATFTTKAIADAGNSCEVLICLSIDSREEVDTIIAAAAAAGGKTDIRLPTDTSFMYGRSVEDVDGHVLEFMWMDTSQMPDTQ